MSLSGFKFLAVAIGLVTLEADVTTTVITVVVIT